jgi:hypothetical protein
MEWNHQMDLFIDCGFGGASRCITAASSLREMGFEQVSALLP